MLLIIHKRGQKKIPREARINANSVKKKGRRIRVEFRNAKLRKEKSDRKKKNKTKKMAKQTTMIRKDPNAVKLELFSNSLKIPERSSSSRTATPEPSMKRKTDSDSEVAKTSKKAKTSPHLDSR